MSECPTCHGSGIVALCGRTDDGSDGPCVLRGGHSGPCWGDAPDGRSFDHLARPALSWWAISGDVLMEMLRRCHAGEDPDLVYAEEYANSEHEQVDGDTGEAG